MDKTLLNSIILEATRKCLEDNNSSSIFEGISAKGNDVDSAKAAVLNKMQDILSTDSETAQNIRSAAKNIGINTDYSTVGAARVRGNQLQVGHNISQEVMDDVKKVIPILRKYIQKSSSAGAGYTVNYDRMSRELPKNEVDFVAKMQDFIDRLGLEWTYNPSIQKTSQSKTYGITNNKDGELDFGDFTFNVTQDSPEFLDYKDAAYGSFKYIEVSHVPEEYWDSIVKYDYVPGTKGGKNTLKINYDSPLYIEVDGHYYMLSVGKNKELLSDCELREKMISSILDKYMVAKYGLELSLPSTVFTAGNNKLPTSTLIINFTSAQRCPAWATCLVKNACYARAGEKLHGNTFEANTKRNLMWQAGLADPEMMKLIEDLLRTYIIDYSVLYKNLRSERKSIKEKKVTIKNIPSIENLRHFRFSEYSPEELEIVKKSTRGIKNIRLNENGDFINQALLDKIDEIAGDLSLIGIRVSAYTCRILNFKEIKNIVINASRTDIKGGAVARYFIALPEKIYDAFDETYDGPNNELGLVKTDDIIKPNFQPLYQLTEGGYVSTGNLYYKCPCGREIQGGGKVNCYQCNLCYEPSEKPYYVFVRVHGGAAARLEEKPLVYGESANFRENYRKLYKKDYVPPIQMNNTGKASLVAEVFDVQSKNYQEQYAIAQITNNAIYSVNTHLNGIFNSQLNESDVRKRFNLMLERLDKTEF